MSAIDLRQIGFTYPGAAEATLSNLDLRVADGEAHALLGASGAGKTTLLNLLSGILHPTSGHLLFDGEDVSSLSGRARNVAQVFQFPVLYESLNVAENLAFPLHNSGVVRKAIDERVDYICDELGLGQLIRQKPRSLSLFQKQLVAVGKALVRPDVSLVLLDEPLTAVEPRVKWQLRQTLRRVQADLQVTMIYVTHDQTEALTFADRVSILTAGGILQTDTPEVVYQSPQHEFVGHFVGSPGMNFVAADALGVDNAQRIGFRPEWAQLSSTGQISGTLQRVRVEGAQQGLAAGLMVLATAHGEVTVRGRLPEAAQRQIGAQFQVQVMRGVAFSNEQQVGTHEFI
ncbi:MAG: ABC transporter ATP-binding protein [bacterium]